MKGVVLIFVCFFFFFNLNLDKLLYLFLLCLAELKLDTNKEPSTEKKLTPSKMSKRRMVSLELLQTEQNYVAILNTILNVQFGLILSFHFYHFKSPAYGKKQIFLFWNSKTYFMFFTSGKIAIL